jgi:hypothetical protein
MADIFLNFILESLKNIGPVALKILIRTYLTK